MLWLLVLALLGLAAARTGDRLALMNYGLVLEERGDVDLNREYWVHTYSVRFPLDIELKQDYNGACIFSNAELCSQHPAVSNHLQRVKADLLREWDTLVAVFQSLPLTSFAQEDPSSPQGQIINAIYNNTRNQDGDNMNFMENSARSSSTRLDSIQVVDLVNDVRSYLSNFKALVAEVEKKLQGNLGDGLASELAAASDRAWQVHVGVQRISNALNAARSNVLTQDLISAKPIEMTLVHLGRLMRSKIHPLIVARLGTTTSYYFNTDVQVYIHHDGDMLFVSVTIPLTYGPRYTAYHVMPFPLVYGNSPYGTLLADLPDYFLLSSDAKLYTTMTANQFAQCQQSQVGVTTCPESQTAVTGNLRPHCLMGLVTENKTMIQQECLYGLLVEPLQPTLWEYSPGLVLLTQTGEAVVRCKEATYRVNAAPVQVVQLPCRCSLSANDMEVQYRLIRCADVSEPRSLFPFNLGALLQVHNPKSLMQYNGTTMLPQAPLIDLPDLALTPPTRQDLHYIHPGMALNLNTMMLMRRAGEKVFTSPVDALLDAEKERLEAGPRVAVTVLAVLGSILLLLCLLAFFVLIKNHSHLSHRLHVLEHQVYFEDGETPDNGMPMQVVTPGFLRTLVAIGGNGDAAEQANLASGGQ